MVTDWLDALFIVLRYVPLIILKSNQCAWSKGKILDAAYYIKIIKKK